MTPQPRKAPSASYLARKLLNTETPWTEPHRDQTGFGLIETTARLEDVISGGLSHQLIPATDPASAPMIRLARTLKTLKNSEQIDSTILERASMWLPPLIVQAKEEEAVLREAADPDHPMMAVLKAQSGPIYFQKSDPLFKYHAASAKRQALETLASGLVEINQCLEQAHRPEARGR